VRRLEPACPDYGNSPQIDRSDAAKSARWGDIPHRSKASPDPLVEFPNPKDPQIDS
jgi:hypothetical protein